MKITEADKWFSLCVRERANFTCERCGTQYSYPAQGLDCSHYFSRTNKAVRVEPLNAFSHCRGCHSFLGDNPHAFRVLVWSRLGEKRYDLLVRLSNDILRGKAFNRGDKSGEIAKFYRAEHQRMLALRGAGQTGRIEFESWYNGFSGSPTR